MKYTENSMLIIIFSMGFMLLILELIRRKKLKEKYALLWLFSASAILTITIFNNTLQWITSFLKITLPSNAVFFLGIIFLILINLHFSLTISSLSEQNRKIVQKIALLEESLKNNSN